LASDSQPTIFALEQDHGYAGSYQHIKLFWIIILLSLAFLDIGGSSKSGISQDISSCSLLLLRFFAVVLDAAGLWHATTNDRY